VTIRLGLKNILLFPSQICHLPLIFTNLKKRFEHIALPAKLLDYFLRGVIQPIPLWVIFSNAVSKAQSSKLERFFSLKHGKKDVRSLSFELLKMSPQVGLVIVLHLRDMRIMQVDLTNQLDKL